MNHLVNITKKELRELFTPGTIASVMVIIVLFVAMGQAFSGESEKISSPAEIGVVYQESPDTPIYASVSGLPALTYKSLIMSAYESAYGAGTSKSHVHQMSAGYGDEDAITKEISEKGYRYVIAVPDTISTNLTNVNATSLPVYYVYKNEGMLGSASSATATSIVAYMSKIAATYVIADGSSLTAEKAVTVQNLIVTGNASAHTLINGKVYTGVTPYEISSTQMSQSMMIPIVVMLVITMVGSVIISSMGSEKENKTLETLLTMPVRRTTIVSGKLVAAAIMGLFYGICYLIGMMFYSNGLTNGLTTIRLEDFGLGMTPVGWAVMFLILFLSILSALGICMILGAFTKNYKMAQTMVMPISILAIIPMLVLMFTSIDALPAVIQAVVFAIPFSHPMMAMSNITMGNTELLLAGIIYLLALDAVLIAITVRLYNSDILITGIDKARIMNKLGIGSLKRKKI